MSRFAAVGTLLSKVRRLGRGEDGGTFIFVAFAAPVFMGGLMLAVDTGTWYMEKRKTQQMADAASLGAVRTIKYGGTVAQGQTVALNDAKRNGYVVQTGNSLVVNSPPLTGAYAGNTLAVEVTVSRELPLFFSKYLFSTGKTVSARSVAYVPTVLGKNLEVAMMLDVSSSMNGNTEVAGTTKLEAMQDAAKALIDTVIQSSQSPYTSRVALVPYSTAVNVGTDSVGGVTYFKKATNKDITGSWTSVVERSGSAQFTDDAPTTNKYFGDFKTKKSSAMGAYSWYVQSMSSNSPASGSKIRPLSTDKDSLKTTINGFTGSGTTAGHLGTAWTWYLLSPNWSSIWTGTSLPNAYGTGTTKAVILLSDFDLNSYYVSGYTSSQQTATLCTNMKAAGLTIYTVGYNVDTSIQAAVDLWNNCASDSSKVYSANTVSQLLAAFQSIAAATVTGALADDIRLAE
jgi:Flp pilus assembly protein TadG